MLLRQCRGYKYNDVIVIELLTHALLSDQSERLLSFLAVFMSLI